MCGICGIALRSGSVNENRLRAMTYVLRHRGPDDAGIFIQNNIGLGHRRLSIIDVEGGHQPMSNEDGTIWIAYNGEVYNHDEVRKRLISTGHRYNTRSDTETLIHLYEDKELESVKELRGMFAYALWDGLKKRVILVRDRLGIKPLYYYFNDGDLIWGSEIKAILESGFLKSCLRLESLPDYLANHYTSGDETLFEGIKRLLPGHILIWEDGEIKIQQYWDLQFDISNESSDENDLIEEFRGLFEHSVKLRLMSDVPLGMFLSGGIDSSAIAAVMGRMIDQPVKTFSVAFREREGNELRYARMVSKIYKTDHHEVTVTLEMFFNALPRLIWQEDEPLAFPSSIPLYFVSELARNHVKVVLTGEGSDELLAGYAKYKKTILNLRIGNLYTGFLPHAVRREIRGVIDRMAPYSRIRPKLIRTFLYLDPGIESIYFDNFSVFSRNDISNLLTSQTMDKLNGTEPYEMNSYYFNRNNAQNLLDRILYTDIKTYLHELLMKQDQMSMAASIESRVPFLDHKLVEFVAKLPPNLKLRGWTTKYILRKAMEDILPKEILHRKKMGFPVPIREWFRKGAFQDLQEYLLGDRAMARGYFNRTYIKNLLHSHISGFQDHSERIWSLLNFEIWNRIFIDGEEIRDGHASA
jgi:asparagine synthase (glutamine-hydrolysing)